MKKLVFVIAVFIGCSALASCGSTADSYCQKLDDCGILDDNKLTVEECKENLEKDYDDMDKHCASDPDKVKDAYNDLLDCVASLECKEIEDEINTEDAFGEECESETREVAAAMIAYCDYFE